MGIHVIHPHHHTPRSHRWAYPRCQGVAQRKAESSHRACAAVLPARCTWRLRLVPQRAASNTTYGLLVFLRGHAQDGAVASHHEAIVEHLVIHKAELRTLLHLQQSANNVRLGSRAGTDCLLSSGTHCVLSIAVQGRCGNITTMTLPTLPRAQHTTMCTLVRCRWCRRIVSAPRAVAPSRYACIRAQ